MKFYILLAIFLSVSLSITHVQASVGGYISSSDTEKLKIVLTKSLKPDVEDVAQIYYTVAGLAALKHSFAPQTVKEQCARIQSLYKPDDSAETTFFAVSSWATLACPGKITTDSTIKNLRTISESESSSTAEIRYALEALKLLGQPVANPTKVAQSLRSKLKEDDSLQSIGHALHAAVMLGNAGKFAHDRIEDVVVQADEVDGKLLQWEGGLSVTSLLVTGLLRLPGAKPLTQSQSDKLAAYLLTRKTVQTPKGVLALLEAADSLSSSNVAPVSVSVIGPSYVTTDKPDLKIRLSDLVGGVLKPTPTPVVAQSATRVTDDVVVLSKQPLTPGTSPTEFVLPLRLEPGQYKIELTAGSHTATVIVRVLGQVNLQSFEIGVTDSDGSSQPQLNKLQPPSKLPTILQADSSQHLLAKFSLSSPIHQTFLRLYSGKKEIIFVAEQDSNKIYKVEVNLASELSHSGKFEIELILGDFVMSNPLRWHLGTIDINIAVPEPPKKQTRMPKPEITHLFRPAENRPPEMVSLVFTALTAAPLLLLLILWLKIGFNFENFTVFAIPFHIGFGAILALFTCFWLKLDMFTTCAWLIPIGGFTFLSGHQLLSRMAQKSCKKTEKADK